MQVFNGQLGKDSELNGFLTDAKDFHLVGFLSTTNTLIGQIVSKDLILQGNLCTTSASLDGNISIPSDGQVDPYEGDYTVVSKPFKTDSIPTKGLKMREDLVVLEIPYYKVSNTNGYTVYIGGE